MRRILLKQRNRDIWDTLSAVLCHGIWCEHNSRHFEGSSLSFEGIREEEKKLVADLILLCWTHARTRSGTA